VSFEQKFLALVKSNLLNFSFMDCDFDVIAKKYLLNVTARKFYISF
jgi:hypothetical protein